MALGGGCSIPVGAYAEIKEGVIEMQGLVAAVDGRQVIKVSGRGEEPQALGNHLAQQALAQGAGGLIDG